MLNRVNIKMLLALTREGSLKVRSGVDSFEEAIRDTDSTSYSLKDMSIL
jgi:hypothetical protein